MRWITAFAAAVTLSLALSVSVSTDVEAKKAKAPKAKLCKATALDGKKVSFRCKADETCCYDGLMAKGNCAPKGQICF